MATISGKVEDANGNGTTGVVRAYRVIDGQFVSSAKSNASTGLYSITTPFIGEPHLVVRSVASVIDADTYLNNCIIGARLQGVNGATFFPETYSSTNWTAVGSPTISTTSPPFTGKASLSLNGSSQLTYAYTAKQHILTNGNNFSIGCWFKRGTGAGGVLVAHNHPSNYNTYAGWSLHVSTTGSVIARIRDMTATTRLLTSTSSVPENTWSHAELSVISNTGYLFVNGVLEATYPTLITTVWAMPDTQPVRIGYSEVYGYFTGNIADVRVSTVGRHSTTFTPPTDLEPTYLTYAAPTGNAQCFDYVIPT